MVRHLGRWSCLLLMLLGAVAAAPAATITYLGGDTNTLAGWRTTSVAKSLTFNPKGNNQYGSDGYWVYAWTNADLPDAHAPLLRSSLPGYVASVTPGDWSGTYVWGGYANIDDPTAAPGASVPDVDAGLFYRDGLTTNPPAEWTAVRLTLASSAEFIVGIVANTHDQYGGPYNVYDLRILQTAGGAADSGYQNFFGDRSGGPTHYSFFRITGAASDEFTVYAHADTNWTSKCLTGLLFETIPEPTAGLLFLAASVLGLIVRRALPCG